MRTIAIANQKGGCGKTTTAINLSAALADAGRKVLLIDLDPQSHASFGLGVTVQIANMTVYNALTDNVEKKRPMDDCILNAAKNLDVMPSNILLSTLEQELKDKEDAVSRLHEILTNTKLDYNYIIIDCPPSLGFLTFNALRASGLVIVPIDMSAYSLMGVGKLLGMLELIKVKINHSPGVNALATLFDKRTKYSQTVLDEIMAFFRDQMLRVVIRVSVALKKAAANGVSVIQFDKKSSGAVDYLALSREILKAEESSLEKAPRDALLAVPGAESERAATADLATTESATPEMRDLNSAIREMIFAINAPRAKEIHLVGDFNHWKMNDESALSRYEDGRWEKKMPLSPGRYRYKFVIDGEWVLDTQNNEKEPNPFGTFDSIINL